MLNKDIWKDSTATLESRLFSIVREMLYCALKECFFLFSMYEQAVGQWTWNSSPVGSRRKGGRGLCCMLYPESFCCHLLSEGLKDMVHTQEDRSSDHNIAHHGIEGTAARHCGSICVCDLQTLPLVRDISDNHPTSIFIHTE